MSNKRIPVEPSKTYHIFNHGVGKENIFRNDENYFYFLQRYSYYIQPIADTFAFCLLPNHFHFLLRIKNEEELITFFSSKKNPEDFQNPQGFETIINQQISHQIGNFLNSYSKSFNKVYSRKGKLFEPEFDRRLVAETEYYKKLIHYIHYNPVHHRFVADMRDWKFTSYESYFSEKATKLQRDEVISWFKDKQGFYDFHKNEINNESGFDLEID